MSGGSLTTKGLISGGGSLTTKGLVSGGGDTIVEMVLAPPPAEPIMIGIGSPMGTVIVVVPTAPNICLMAAENITANLRVRQAASLTLPSLFKRAYLIAHETDEIAVAKP